MRKKQTGKKFVIALGGNAILNKGEKGVYKEQMRNIIRMAENIAELAADKKCEIIITHGNGPQIGNIMIQNAAAKNTAPEMPIFVCGAMSQGQIGYLIQQGLNNVLKKRNIKRRSAAVITRVVVDEKSPTFADPVKPIGPYYTEEEAKKITGETGCVFKEDAGRGWRQVVPSPVPIKILEIDAVKILMKSGIIVIAAGGGGIPVKENNGQISGLDAVIDKDLTAALLGDLLDADTLIILTPVEKVYLNYGKAAQSPIDKINLKKARKYLREGHFAEGSMKPKIEAAINFIKKDKQRKVIITSPEKMLKALTGETGTRIFY
ncbi:MAG: carbamate kinase [bacterium]|nr:carbamate kinase [bacterium]